MIQVIKKYNSEGYVRYYVKHNGTVINVFIYKWRAIWYANRLHKRLVTAHSKQQMQELILIIN